MSSPYRSFPSSPPASLRRPLPEPRTASDGQAPRNIRAASTSEQRYPGRRTRRGHSDCDVLRPAATGSEVEEHPLGERRQAEIQLEGGQTLQEFLQQFDQVGRLERDGASTQRSSMARERRRPERLHRHSEGASRSGPASPYGAFPRAYEVGQPRSPRVTGLRSPSAPSPVVQQEEDRPVHPGRRLSEGNLAASTYLKPRWQPDSKVSACPICGRVFSFFYRKHHCRKCGRVVCSNCSPHRITIPRQYIVEPPEVSIGGQGDDQAQNELGDEQTMEDSNTFGGQEVRLCNPCVPDPNPLPPPDYRSIAHTFVTSHLQQDGAGNDTVRYEPSSQQDGVGMYEDSQSSDLSRRRSATDPHARIYANGSTDRRTSRQPGINQVTSALEGMGFLPQPSAHRAGRHRTHMSTSAIPPHPPPNVNAPLPPRPVPRRIREEDECPICHNELPPRDIDNSESEREAHVAACIEEHLAPGARSIPVSSSIRTTTHASTTDPGTGASSAPANRQLLVPVSSYQSRPRAETHGYANGGHRRANMLVYHASEKDCVEPDGKQKECVICLEDFVVGDELGRLECWCAFHRKCIREWWDMKGIGACPTHQDGI